jgi:hypothetical protein
MAASVTGIELRLDRSHEHAPGLSSAILSTESAHLGVVDFRQLGAECLALAGDYDDARTAQTERAVVLLEQAEEPVVVPLRPVDANLIIALHLVMHGFPFATAGKAGRWSFGDGRDDGEHHRSNFLWARAKKVAAWDASTGIVLRIPLEEMDAPRHRQPFRLRGASLLAHWRST